MSDPADGSGTGSGCPMGHGSPNPVDYTNLELKDLNYNSYLKVSELLSLQKQISDPPHHDEMFFIIIHQAAELWFKEILHEGKMLVQALREDSISRSLKIFKRLTAIMDLQVKQINLLSTLTPVEFAGFRDHLRPASGFQSFQFRKIEFFFGIREAFFLTFFKSEPARVAELAELKGSPSVYDEFLHCLHRAGFKVPDEILKRDFGASREAHREVVACMKEIYENPQDNYHWVLMFETMMDFDEKLALWRSTHILMVQRTIGLRSGTGGSAGAKFLQSREHMKLFPDIWEVRNSIGTGYGG